MSSTLVSLLSIPTPSRVDHSAGGRSHPIEPLQWRRFLPACALLALMMVPALARGEVILHVDLPTDTTAAAAQPGNPIGPPILARFRFAPSSPVASVHLAGSFNAWSLTSHPMTDADGDGVYEAEVQLDGPAIYEYKYLIDGEEWLLDPDVPSTSDGLYTNSLLDARLFNGRLTRHELIDFVNGEQWDGNGVAPSTNPFRPRDVQADARRRVGLALIAIAYRHPRAESVELFYGMDGWGAPPEPLDQPAWTHEDGPVAISMDRRRDGEFIARVAMPIGTQLDFVFHITAPFEAWDNNGGAGVDYHVDVERDASIWIQAAGAHTGISSDGADAATERTGGSPWMSAADSADQTTAAFARTQRVVIFGGGTLLVLALLGAGLGGRVHGESTPLRRRVGIALAVALLAWGLRAPMVADPEPEIDEEAYVPLAMSFAHRWSTGDWEGIRDERHVFEHPRAAFMLHAIAIRLVDASNDFRAAMFAARSEAVLLSVFAAAALAWWWPVAGVGLALFGLGAKYTSLAYLDASTLLFATLAVLLFDAAVRRAERVRYPDDWHEDDESAIAPPAGSRRTRAMLAISAVAAGACVSSKYLGAVAPIAVAAGFGLWWLQSPRRPAPEVEFDSFDDAPSRTPAPTPSPPTPANWWTRGRIARAFAGYVAIAIAAMFVTDPSLWTLDAPARLYERVTFHRAFSQSDLVTDFDAPWYQPIVWLWTFTAIDTTSGWWVFDRAVTLLGLVGLPLLLWREPRLGLAALVTLAFLFVWPTKWPQYEVVLLPWLAISAALLLSFLHRQLPPLLHSLTQPHASSASPA